MIFFARVALKIIASITFTCSTKSLLDPGLRTRGHDFILSFVRYDLNKKNFMVLALYNYI